VVRLLVGFSIQGVAAWLRQQGSGDNEGCGRAPSREL
jgi:hypothetical protein